jgi:hypothetical protein
MKSIGCFWLLVLCLMITGCTTTAMVKRAKGYTDEQVQPSKGDDVFQHRGNSYVIQKQRRDGENVEVMPREMLQGFPPPYYAFKPCPGAYPFLVFTVPFDAATLPLQVIGLGLFYSFMHFAHE